jgi:hypothetical protein
MTSATRKPCRYIRKSRLAPPEPALLYGLQKALDFTRLAPHLAETARACVSWERRTYDMDIQSVVHFLAEHTCAQPPTSRRAEHVLFSHHREIIGNYSDDP